MTAKKATPITKVPGAVVLMDNKGREYVQWPNGKKTKLHMPPLMSPMENNLYHLDPFNFNSEDYQKVIKR